MNYCLVPWLRAGRSSSFNSTEHLEGNTLSEKLNVSKSVELYQKACQLIPAGSQTNSKRPATYAPGAYPIYFETTKGCRVTDIDGNTYIDYVLGLGPITLGYCYDAVDEAVSAQLKKGIIAGLLAPAEVEVAEKMKQLVPCAEMTRYMKGGAEGTTAAARMARGFSGKEIILNSGYRGWADGWAAANNTIGVPKCLGQVVKSFPRDDLNALEDLLKQHKGEVAAIAVDVAGGTAAPQEAVEGMRTLADEYDALLIFDEIVSGFRMARGGAQEYYGVTPDIAVFAKGMANGLPVAAVSGRADILEASKDYVISITYGGEALSLAGAAACLDVYANNDVTGHMFAQGDKLRIGFESSAQANGVPFKCHGPSCMHSMSFSYDDAGLNQQVWTLFLQEAAKRGVLLRRGGLLFITFSHDDAAIAETIVAVDGAMQVVAEAVEGGKVADMLETGSVEESFRRFT